MVMSRLLLHWTVLKCKICALARGRALSSAMQTLRCGAGASCCAGRCSGGGLPGCGVKVLGKAAPQLWCWGKQLQRQREPFEADALGTATGAGAAGSSVGVLGVAPRAVVGGAVVGSSLEVLGAAAMDSASVVSGAALGSAVALLDGAVTGSTVVELRGAVVGSLLVMLGRAVAGCSVEELGDAVESTPDVELGASDEGSSVVLLGPGVEGASVVAVGATVLLVVGVTMLGSSVEAGNSVEVELGNSVEVGGAVVAIGIGLQGKGWGAQKRAQ